MKMMNNMNFQNNNINQNKDELQTFFKLKDLPKILQGNDYDEMHRIIYQESQKWIEFKKDDSQLIIKEPVEIPAVNQWYFVPEKSFPQRKFLQVRFKMNMLPEDINEAQTSNSSFLFDYRSYSKDAYNIRIVKVKNRYSELKYGLNQLKKHYLIYTYIPQESNEDLSQKKQPNLSHNNIQQQQSNVIQQNQCYLQQFQQMNSVQYPSQQLIQNNDSSQQNIPISSSYQQPQIQLAFKAQQQIDQKEVVAQTNSINQQQQEFQKNVVFQRYSISDQSPIQKPQFLINENNKNMNNKIEFDTINLNKNNLNNIYNQNMQNINTSNINNSINTTHDKQNILNNNDSFQFKEKEINFQQNINKITAINDTNSRFDKNQLSLNSLNPLAQNTQINTSHLNQSVQQDKNQSLNISNSNQIQSNQINIKYEEQSNSNSTKLNSDINSNSCNINNMNNSFQNSISNNNNEILKQTQYFQKINQYSKTEKEIYDKNQQQQQQLNKEEFDKKLQILNQEYHEFSMQVEQKYEILLSEYMETVKDQMAYIQKLKQNQTKYKQQQKIKKQSKIIYNQKEKISQLYSKYFSSRKKEIRSKNNQLQIFKQKLLNLGKNILNNDQNLQNIMKPGKSISQNQICQIQTPIQPEKNTNSNYVISKDIEVRYQNFDEDMSQKQNENNTQQQLNQTQFLKPVNYNGQKCIEENDNDNDIPNSQATTILNSQIRTQTQNYMDDQLDNCNTQLFNSQSMQQLNNKTLINQIINQDSQLTKDQINNLVNYLSLNNMEIQNISQQKQKEKQIEFSFLLYQDKEIDQELRKQIANKKTAYFNKV